MNEHFLQISRCIAVLALSSTLSLTLSGCSTTSESFDCKAGSGVGCKSISEVNQMVNQGTLHPLVESDTAESRGMQSKLPLNTGSLSTPIIASETSGIDTLKIGTSPTVIPLSGTFIVHRMPEEYLRVWIAPFQDQQGNLHEGSVIHTILKPGYWQLKTPPQSPKDSHITETTNLNLEEHD